MRRAMRMLAALCIFSLAVAGAAALPARADGDVIPTYEQFLADQIIGYSSYKFYMSESNYKPYVELVEKRLNSALYMADLAAWKLATFQSSDLVLDPFYTTVIHDILIQNISESKVASTLDKLAKAPQASLNKKIVSLIQETMGLSENSRILDASFLDMPAEDQAAIYESICKLDELKKIFGTAGKVASFFSHCKDVEDAINKCAKARALHQTCAECAEVLADMAKQTDNQEFRDALNLTADICAGAVNDGILNVIFSMDSAINVIVDEAEGYVWGALCDALGSWGLVIESASAIGKTAGNVLFSTDAQIEVFYEMVVLYDYDAGIKKVLRQYEEAYAKSRANDDAERFATAYINYLNTMIQGCEYAKEFMRLNNEKVDWQSLAKEFGFINQTWRDYNAAVDNIIKTLKAEIDLHSYNNAYALYMDIYHEDLLNSQPDYATAEPTMSEDEVNALYQDLLKTLTEFGRYNSLDFLKYTVSTDSVTITGYTGEPRWLTIPAEIEGKSVNTVGDRAFRGCTSLVTVELPETLTDLNSNAFSGCTALSKLHLPDSVERMGAYIFQNCPQLKSMNYPKSLKLMHAVNSINYSFTDSSIEYIEVPEGVTQLVPGAFSNATALKKVDLPGTLKEIGYRAFNGCKSLGEISVPNSVETMGNWSFSGCTGLSEIRLPQSITSAGQGAFENCTGLTSVYAKGTALESIGDRAFRGCTSLVTVELPETLTDLNSNAFSGCTALSKLHLPDSVERMGEYIFQNCPQLKSMNYPKSLKLMHAVNSINYSFTDSSIEYIEVPEGVTQLVPGAFSNATALKNVYLPSTLLSIGNRAFNNCSALRRVYLGYGEGKIADFFRANFPNATLWPRIDGARPGAEEKSDLMLPAGMKQIGAETFEGTAATSIFLQDGIKAIGDRAFAKCFSLRWIYIPASVTSISDTAFTGCRSNLIVMCEPDSYVYNYLVNHINKFRETNKYIGSIPFAIDAGVEQ